LRASALTAVLALAITLLLGAAFLAVDMFWLGRIDPKWGGPWDNFVFGVQLLAVASLVEAVALGFFVAISARHTFVARRSRLTSAIVMAVATILIWPPTSRRPILMAALVAAIALLAGSVSAWLASRTDQATVRHRDATGA
jgi:hypothetical protein